VRLAILTTETPHHAFFVREVGRRFAITQVFCETEGLRPPFDTAHPFEVRRDDDERQVWFGGERRTLEDFAPTRRVASVNEPAAVAALSAAAPDVVLVFGTGRLRAPVIAVQPRLMLNLHGGDPEEYRGLDTHLWAVYHRDFSALLTTLHRVAPELDDGDMVLQAPVALRGGMSLYELRRANTVVCVELATAALSAIAAHGDLPSRPQRRKGRYYSFMPSALKEICCRSFAANTARLAAAMS
jgi:methionyl-tRNA formyltransferase